MVDFEVVRLPPNYSDADRTARDDIADKLHRLQRDCQNLCAPLVKRLTEIDSRYAPKVVLIPKPLKEG
jgi:hypothetical protein